ncbi:ABC transporter ATP-binding protein [Crassaminicella thermophila]|uniref:ABC-type quaternary amine transporter n=1 Tax=Crassaminicella thermophila TaxID=2599308 RepID=A0A5C0SED7_CRATE|nr:ABC transporter ATP-binding protein [Crassaminicella thermophila]QEK12985.1 ABC transporter ATP-binding protein [Crassaminicella thermophila]
MSGIELRNISKSFEHKQVLDNINLSVKEGEMVSLLGPSGCGKTTTLKMIAGLIHPDSGDILFNNKSVLDVPVEKRGAVIVFQEYLLFPHLTIEENVGFGLKMAKVKKLKQKEIVKKMLDLVQLNGYERKYPNELSGGQRQRVAIARALAIEPKVLLLDEPFSNLDTILRANMREFICNIQKSLNITTILVTHDKEEALMTSDKIAVMLRGKIRQFGTPTQLYERPVTPEVANFFGEKNYIVGNIENGIFKSKLGAFETTFDKYSVVKAMIKPEEIEVLPKDIPTGVKGKIILRRYAGDRVYYTISVNGVQLKSISNTKKIFDINEEVSLKIDVDKAVFYENR